MTISSLSDMCVVLLFSCCWTVLFFCSFINICYSFYFTRFHSLSLSLSFSLTCPFCCLMMVSFFLSINTYFFFILSLDFTNEIKYMCGRSCWCQLCVSMIRFRLQCAPIVICFNCLIKTDWSITPHYISDILKRPLRIL